MRSDIQNEIKVFYGALAKTVNHEAKISCGCDSSCCVQTEDQQGLYPEDLTDSIPIEALNASLGCANPITLANLQVGETVLDLGSGGGIDVLISAKYVGETGKAYGLDMTDEMIELANQNKIRSGLKNVEFLKGYIEDIPLDDETVDVLTSNCVINLSLSKESVLKEAYRVLKKGGRLAIADIVQLKDIPEELRQNTQMWVSCFSGALTINELDSILHKVGFKNIEITPVHVYNQDVFINKPEHEKRDMTTLEELKSIDKAFGSAYIVAYKL